MHDALPKFVTDVVAYLILPPGGPLLLVIVGLLVVTRRSRYWSPPVGARSRTRIALVTTAWHMPRAAGARIALLELLGMMWYAART